MTPPNGVDLKSTAEREAAKTEEAAHMHRCEHEEGGPVHGIRAKLEDVEAKLGKVMLRQSAWNGGALVLQLIGMAVFAAWISSRFSQPQPQQHQHASESASLVKSAHAETKGTP